MNLGDTPIGPGHPCFVIAELGISHNGDVGIAKRMIEAAANAGANAVKLQKRTVDVVYSRPPYAEGYLDQPREHPLGGAQTQRGQKEALELSRSEWEVLAMHARERGLQISASCWDEQALADVIEWIDPGWLKVASPVALDGPLMRAHGATGLPLVVSTGMMGPEDVERCLANIKHARWEAAGPEGVDTAANLALLHCCSAYPAEDEELNLACMQWMANRWPYPVGYSGHERGIATSVWAAALGACIVERHLTLDRTMYGSDQSASLEPHGFARMVRDIRAGERAMGDGVKRMRPSEEAAAAKMRREVD